MNHNNTPDMGMSIYMNDCNCRHLWDEMETNDARIASRSDRDKDDSCQPQCDFEGWKLAMAYVPMQPWEEPFDPAKGLGSGTIFPSLFLPFKGGGRK